MKPAIAVILLLFCTIGRTSASLSTLISGAGKGSKCPTAGGKGCPRDVTFWLYTKTHKNGVSLDQKALNKAPFSKGPLKVIIHGYWNDRNSYMNKALKEAYFGYGDYNIIVVDWSAYSKSGCYNQAVASVQGVGHCVGDFLGAVQKAHRGGIHILGHSLGAHVSEVASGSLSPHAERLTKFDPAGPMFQGKTTKGTAGFVDVYHSNAGVAGQAATSGDVDVYINNGAFQPGCKCDIACSHMRSVEIFAESIKSKGIKAFPCAGWAQYTGYHCRVPTLKSLVTVGDPIDTKTKGSFMLFTNAKAPFAIKDTAYTSKTSFYGFQKSVSVSCKAGDLTSIIREMGG